MSKIDRDLVPSPWNVGLYDHDWCCLSGVGYEYGIDYVISLP